MRQSIDPIFTRHQARLIVDASQQYITYLLNLAERCQILGQIDDANQCIEDKESLADVIRTLNRLLNLNDED